MFIVKLFRHVTGTDDDTRSEEARLQKNLNGMRATNDDLERLEAEVSGILSRVDSHSRRQQHSLPSGASGVHRLDLPQEVEVHVRGEIPPEEHT